jgi:hypothetical protein
MELKQAVYNGSLGTVFPKAQSSSLTGNSSSGHGSGAANGIPLVSMFINLDNC